MALFRRRQPDPVRRAVLDGFAPIGEAVEAGQRALLRAVPTFREDGIPIAIALAEFGAHLDEAIEELGGWQAPPDLVNRCRSAIDSARAEAERLRLEPDGLVFEALNARLSDILFPLESVADLEAELREALRG